MPSLKLYIIDYEGPEPIKTLEDALAKIFPAGVSVRTEPVDEIEEPTDLEPVDEPTVTEPAKTPGRSGSVSRDELQRIVDLVNECDGNRVRAAEKEGVSKNTILYRLKQAAKAGIAVPPAIRGNPKHREQRPTTSDDTRSVVVPPRPKRGRPPTRAQQPGAINELIDHGPIAAAVDAIASELIVMEPQTPVMLEKRTKFRREIIDQALQDSRFRKTGGGYALAALKR